MTTINQVSGLNTNYAKFNNAEPQAEAPKPVETKANTLQQDTVSFSGHKEEEKVAKKHPFKAIASFILPGSGQVANGEIIKGIGYFGLAFAAAVPAAIFSIKKLAPTVMKNMPEIKAFIDKKGFKSHFSPEYYKTAYKGVSKKVMAGYAALVGLSFIPRIMSVKDAYNGGNK